MPHLDTKAVMEQIISLTSWKIAVKIQTHCRMQHETCYQQWKKLKYQDKENNTEEIGQQDGLYLDPEKVRLNDLIATVWRILCDLEDANPWSFALFLEIKPSLSCVTLDTMYITHIYKAHLPQ